MGMLFFVSYLCSTLNSLSDRFGQFDLFFFSFRVAWLLRVHRTCQCNSHSNGGSVIDLSGTCQATSSGDDDFFSNNPPARQTDSSCTLLGPILQPVKETCPTTLIFTGTLSNWRAFICKRLVFACMPGCASVLHNQTLGANMRKRLCNCLQMRTTWQR